MSEGKIIEIYNQGLTEVMSVIKELTNEIKGLNFQKKIKISASVFTL